MQEQQEMFLPAHAPELAKPTHSSGQLLSCSWEIAAWVHVTPLSVVFSYFHLLPLKYFIYNFP